MKIFILFSTLVFSIATYADEVSIGHCDKEIMKFGDGSGRDEISQDCIDLYFKSATPQAIKKSQDGKVTVFAYRNMIVIQDPAVPKTVMNLIAGTNTELEEIVALTIDEVNKEIVALEKNGNVLVFSSAIIGNVAARRVIKHRELEGSNDVAVNNLTNEILVQNSKTNELFAIPRNANSKGREKDRNFSVMRRPLK